MRTLVGLQKKISGEILFGDGLCKNETGYFPQKFSVDADFPASVREIVLSGTLGQFKNRPFYGKAQKMIADEQMEKVGISSLARRRFTELSGGQQQRTLLARALCAAKSLFFLTSQFPRLTRQPQRNSTQFWKNSTMKGFPL